MANSYFEGNAYFVTNVVPFDPSSKSVNPNVSGTYVQDFTSLKTAASSVLGDGVYSTKISHMGTTFLQKEILESTQASYEVFIKYVDGTGTTYGMNLTVQDPILLPWRSNTNVFVPIPMFQNGDPLQAASKYTVRQQRFGSYELLLLPGPGVTTNEIPDTIIIDINCYVATVPGDSGANLKKFYLTSFTIDNTIYPTGAQEAIQVALPYWLQWPYWISQIYASQNVSAIESLPAIGGYPLSNTTLRRFFGQNAQALMGFSLDKPDGVPEAFIQIELNPLDLAFVGNSSNGRILTTGIMTPVLPNASVYREIPHFKEQTQQNATAFQGLANLQFTVTDRFGKPFLSLLSNYDVITQVKIQCSKS
jgi:hypothetical protein